MRLGNGCTALQARDTADCPVTLKRKSCARLLVQGQQALAFVLSGEKDSSGSGGASTMSTISCGGNL